MTLREIILCEFYCILKTLLRSSLAKYCLKVPLTDVIQPVVKRANYLAERRDTRKKLKNEEMKQRMDELADMLLHLDNSNRDSNFGGTQKTRVNSV